MILDQSFVSQSDSLDKASSNNNHDEKICWICGAESEKNKFCDCKVLGTMGYVHSKCLNHWVNSKNGDLFNTTAMRNINRPNIPIKCDICGYVYDYVILREKINKANCLRQWFFQKYGRVYFQPMGFSMICLVFAQIVFLLASFYDIFQKGGSFQRFLYLFIGITLTIAAFYNMVNVQWARNILQINQKRNAQQSSMKIGRKMTM